MQMDKTIAVTLTFCIFLLSGCASTKKVAFVDSRGDPVGRCYVFVSQENILYPNSRELLVADEKGRIEIPYRGLVRFYAGKEGFFISTFALVGEANVRAVIYSPKDKIPAHGMRTKITKPPEEFLEIGKRSPEAKNWIKYVTATPFVIVAEQPVKTPPQ